MRGRAAVGVVMVVLGIVWSSAPATAADAAHDTGHLVVLEAATGEPRWDRAPEGGPFNQLLFAMPGRRVVLAKEGPCGSDTLESRNRLVAFDAANGSRRWAKRGVRMASSWPLAAPIAADAQGVVVVVAGRTVRGLRATTGDEVWRVEGGLHPAPQVSSNAVFMNLDHADGKPTFESLDRRTGERRFSFSPPSESAGILVLVGADDRRVVVASGGYSGGVAGAGGSVTLFVLDARTGHELGRFADDGVLDDWQGSVIAGDSLVNLKGRPTRLRVSDPPQGTIVARDLPDGAVRWQTRAETLSAQSLMNLWWSSDPEVVVAQPLNPAPMVALDLATGLERWRRDAVHYDSAGEGRLIAMAVSYSPYHESLVAIDAQTGDVEWDKDLPAAVGDSSLYVSASAFGSAVALSNPCIAD